MSNIDFDIVIFEQNLIKHLRTCKLLTGLKKQSAYLSPQDTDIAFNEFKHIYTLPEFSEQFPISVTGFCKKFIHNNEFNITNAIRNLNIESNCIEYDYHACKLLEWKYSAVFGSFVHAMIEYFFTYIVNDCKHELCHQQDYDKDMYDEYLVDVTNEYYLKNGIASQAAGPDKRFRCEPIMPCIYTRELLQILQRVICDEETMKLFLRNNPLLNITNELYIREISDTMSSAFELNKRSLKAATRRYRENFPDNLFEDELDKIIAKDYTIHRYIRDMEEHLKSFAIILSFLPLQDCCDIRPEHIVFNRDRGLAGSVDLIMRSRLDPRQLYMFDWKTCKKIFATFRRDNEQTNQLMDYACQLHTYANMMTEVDNKLKINIFVVNITCTDSCIYNVKDYKYCKCHPIYNNFHLPIIPVDKQ